MHRLPYLRAQVMRWTALLALAASGTAFASDALTVRTAQGDVQGTTVSGVRQFRGIPYAKPPVGDLRWVSPQAPDPWQGVRDATRFGPSCPQVCLR